MWLVFGYLLIGYVLALVGDFLEFWDPTTRTPMLIGCLIAWPGLIFPGLVAALVIILTWPLEIIAESRKHAARQKKEKSQ